MTSTTTPTETNTTNTKPILIIHRLPTITFWYPHRLTPFSHLLDPLTISPTNPTHVLRREGASARALLCVGLSPVNKDTLDCLPSLQCVVTTSVGTDHVDLPECRSRGIAVTNVGEAFSDDAADCAVALLVDVLRRVSAFDRFVRAGLWPIMGDVGELPLGRRVGGKRVGIVGLGSIGSRVAKRLAAFGCIIGYNSRHKKPSFSYRYYDNIYNLALDSDVLVLCCSLTDQTHRIINKDILTALGNDGVIINVGRGGLVDESELVRFLVEGKIKGAGLDVFENEPNVPSELFELDNVVLSPHQAVITPESFKASEDAAVANLEAFFAGKPLITPVQ